MNVIEKELSLYDVCVFYELGDKLMASEKSDLIPVKLAWALNKNLETIRGPVAAYHEYKDEKAKEIQEKYFSSDEYSYDDMITQIGEDGKEFETEGRRIKEDYIEEYQTANKELEKEFVKKLSETDTYMIITYDISNFISDLPDDSKIVFSDIGFLTYMDEDK